MRCHRRAHLSLAFVWGLGGAGIISFGGCSTDDPGGSEGPDDVTLDGAALYVSKGCVNCHGPLETSQKRNASFERIRVAAGSESQIAQMRPIQLTDAEIQALVEALSDGPSGPDRRRPLVKPLLLTRSEVGSRLYGIFRGVDGLEVEEERLFEIIEVYIQAQPAFFGGHCNKYDGCEGADISANQNPGASAVRAGVLVRTCLEILAVPNTDRAALAKAGLTPASAVDRANVRATWDVFAPGRPLSDASVDLVVSATDSSGSAWSTVLKLFCRPTVLEAI